MNIYAIAICSAALVLSGCASVQPANTSEMIARQISQSTLKADGELLASSPGSWYPNTRGFDFANDLSREVNGAVVVTDRMVLMQRWGGENGLTVVHKIPLSDIAHSSVARWGFSTRLVITQRNDRNDSFAVEDSGSMAELISSRARSSAAK